MQLGATAFWSAPVSWRFFVTHRDCQIESAKTLAHSKMLSRPTGTILDLERKWFSGSSNRFLSKELARMSCRLNPARYGFLHEIPRPGGKAAGTSSVQGRMEKAAWSPLYARRTQANVRVRTSDDHRRKRRVVRI